MKSPRPWPRLRVRVERLQPSNRWDFLSLPPSTPSLPLCHYPSLLTSLSHSLPPFLQEATHNALGRKLPHNEYSTSKLEYGRRQGADRPLKYSQSFINAANMRQMHRAYEQLAAIVLRNPVVPRDGGKL